MTVRTLSVLAWQRLVDEVIGWVSFRVKQVSGREGSWRNSPSNITNPVHLSLLKAGGLSHDLAHVARFQMGPADMVGLL